MNEFVSLVKGGGKDLHLSEGADAFDAGPNLSTMSAIDIDGEIRPIGMIRDREPINFRV